jgi:hypothetical protein
VTTKEGKYNNIVHVIIIPKFKKKIFEKDNNTGTSET